MILTLSVAAAAAIAAGALGHEVGKRRYRPAPVVAAPAIEAVEQLPDPDRHIDCPACQARYHFHEVGVHKTGIRDKALVWCRACDRYLTVTFDDRGSPQCR